MKMARSRLWLLLLCIFPPCLGTCTDSTHGVDLPWTDAQKLQPADSFFDVTLCTEGVQWTCFVPMECVKLTAEKHELRRSDDLEVLNKCHAVMAIQVQTEKKWRVIMQAVDVAETSSLKFIGNCFTEFQCKPDNNTAATGQIRLSAFAIKPEEWYGIYNKDQKKLMCEFTVASLRPEDNFPMKDSPLYSGMMFPYESYSYKSNIISKTMHDEVIVKIQKGCKIEMNFHNPNRLINNIPGEDFKRVNQDKTKFHCPTNYDMRWAESPTTDALHSTTGMECLPGQQGVTINFGTSSPQTRQGLKEVQCVHKKCKHCVPPVCPPAANCPTVIHNDYANRTVCAQLKCTGKNESLDYGGQLHSEAICTDGKRWTINGAEVQNINGITCRAKKSCPDAQNAITMQDVEKFNVEKHGEDAAVVCREEGAKMSYTVDEVEVQLVAVVCNTADGQWYETANRSGVPIMEPYKNGTTLQCTVPEKAAVAKGGVLMYAGIGLAAAAVIIGIILLICCCLSRNKKRKNRLSAVKHQLANKDSKSRNAKTVSKGTTSKGTTSKGSSDRSVTGARGKKRRSGDEKEDGPAIPDDGEPKKPEPRSKPATGSSITKTSDLQKLQDEEERKKAAAAAALLETSKVEDKEEPQTDTPIDTVVFGKDTRDLEQPDKTPFSPNKPLQKRRLKRATIIESNDPPPPRVTELAVQPAPESEPPTPTEQSPAPAPASVMAKTQAGGGADEDDEKEQPMWHNQPQAAPAPEPVPAPELEQITQIELLRSYAAPAAAAAAAPASDPQDEMKTSREKERDAAAESAARKKKIADMPTGKKKESAKKVKSSKLTTPKAELKEPKKARSSFLKPSDLAPSDKSSSKKGGGKSKKATKRAADEPSKKMDATQHQHVHGSEVGCGPLCAPMPRSHTDPDEEN